MSPEDSLPARGLSRPFPRWTAAAVFLLAFALAIPIQAKLGMDSTWDTANYHFYIGWAAATGYLYEFGAVSQYRAYLNPLLDLVNYAAFHRNAYVGALLHSLIFALDACLVFLLARR